MAANKTPAQNGAATELNLQPSQTVEVNVTAGQTLHVGSGVTVAGISEEAGALVVTFSNGATLKVANFADVKAMGNKPALVFANGHKIDIATLAATEAAEAFATNATDKTAAATEVVVDAPKAGESVVLTLEQGKAYAFGFAMNEPASVSDNKGQMVITFKNGGEIIIPNYGTMKDSSGIPQITLKDGASVPVSDFGDILATAAQLNAVEPAAGGDAGGSPGRGFGFQSAYATTPFASVDPIGPINPTQLQYDVSDRRPKPLGDTTPPAISPNLELTDSLVFEDGSVALDISALPRNSQEQLTLVITGIDTSWTVDTSVSGGTYDALTGTWTLVLPKGTGFVGGPLLSPPADSDADMPGLNVTLTITNASTGQVATVGGVINVTTDAVADVPDATGTNAGGVEDTPIALNFATAVNDLDGSETITSVVISGVPAGAALNNGVDLGGGNWQLTVAQLTGLTITPPLNYSGSFPLTMTVVATESNLTDTDFVFTNNTATNAVTVQVTVEAVADKPLLEVKDAEVKEDGFVDLQVKAELTDKDGSETLTVTISGIDPAWGVDTTFSGGTYAAGTWTITLPAGVTSFNGGPRLSPPADSDADLTGLIVTATATESNGSTASENATLDIVTDAVIDAPVLTASNASGLEDTPVALTITLANGGDTDGSESYTSIILSGVPAGFSLSAGTNLGGGQWSLTPAQFAGLTLTPAKDFNGTVNLTMTVVEKETTLSGGEYDTTDNEATVTANFSVTFGATGDAPTLKVEDQQVKEDGSVKLLVDADLTGPATDYLVITISNIDPTWTVSNLPAGSTYDSTTGVWTITLAPGASFLDGPTFAPPADSDADMTGIVVTATAVDPLAGTSTSVTDTAKITVDAVIDAPTLTVANASGNEDTAIPLNISAGQGGDTTDGSEVLSVITISGVPAGAILSAGTNLGGGVWQLTGAQLTGLTLTPATNYSGSFNLTVSVTDTETNLSGDEFDTTDNTATVTKTVGVTVVPDADQPNLTVKNAYVKEDGSVALEVTASLNDTDGSEQLTVTISGIAAGWGVNTALSGGTYNVATGTWTLALPVGVTSFTGGPTLTPPANSDVDLNGLVVTATATELANGDTATRTGNINVVVDAVIDGPSITAPDVTGSEDTAIALNITVGRGGDTADGSEVLSNITISGVPAGATLSAGTNLGGGVWSLTTAQLTGLKITPAANYNGNFTLTVSVTDTETNLSGVETDLTDNSATVTDTVKVTVNPVDDNPRLEVSGKSIKEDTSTTLPLTASLATGSAATDYLVITITGILPGWTVNTATSGGTYNAATGTWTRTVAAGQNYSGSPTFTPPADSDADMNGLVVTVRQYNAANVLEGTSSATVGILVDAVIDGPSISAPDATGNEDSAIALNITVSRGGDTTDGSEVLSNVTISGVPAGATLSAGTNLGGGVWSLTTAQLTGLKITPAADYNGNFTLTVSVTDTETNLSGNEVDLTDNSATATDTIKVTVNPVDDTPSLDVDNVVMKEDTSKQLPLTANLATGSLATDYLVVTITGILPGWTVNTAASGGTYNAATGTWTRTVAAGQNYTGGPVFTPPANSDADMNGLVVTVKQYNAANVLQGTVTETVGIVVDAVIDGPSINAPDVTIDEDNAIPLTITVGAGGDTADGSETLSNITISGVPSGFTLSAGANLGGGVWSLTPAQLVGLKLNPTANYNGVFNLTVSVTDTETNLSGSEVDLTDNSATATDTIKVTVRPVDDLPKLESDIVYMKEDTSAQLPILAELAPGTAATDYLVVTISGVLPGWTVNTTTSGGTYNAATGVWTLTVAPGQNFFGGPIFTPPLHSDVDMPSLTVKVQQFDTFGVSQGTRTLTTGIIVDAVIDAPAITAADVTGNEDTAISLNISVSKGGDTTDGSEVLSNVTISGVPAGATLSAGTNLGGGVWSLTTAQLSGLKLNPAPNFNGMFNLTVSVTDTETNLSGVEYDLTDNSATVTKTIKVTVNDVADDPTVRADDICVKEDMSGQLVVSSSLAAGSPATDYLVITITGILASWGVNTAASGGTYDPLTGTWTRTVAAGQNYSGGPTFFPPADSDVDMTGLVVTAKQYNGAGVLQGTSTDGATIKVDAVIDGPAISMSFGASDNYDQMPLNITVNRGGDNTDGSEVLSNITVSGLPSGATLSAGTNLGGGVWSLTTAQLPGLKINFAPGTSLTNLTLTASVTETEANLSGADCDPNNNSATATTSTTLTFDQPVLIVGKNVDDITGSSTPWQVGTGNGVINGKRAADILVGDVGGYTLVPQDKDFNIVLILDISGSMGSKTDPNSKYSLLMAAVKNLLQDFNDYTGGTVKVHIAPFATGAQPVGTFTVTDDAGFAAANTFIDNMNGSNGFTNYEAGMQSAITWLQGSSPIAGAETYTYFISDGEPNRYIDSSGASVSGSEAVAMGQISGSDGTNEIAILKSLSTEVIGVGVDIGAKIANIHLIDSNGVALNIDDAQDLQSALSGASPLTSLNGVGDDVLNGGDSADLMFGDSLYTDLLAQAHGLSGKPGAGWEVFARLEAGESALNPGWTRADTIAYIKANAEQLAQESTGAGNSTRAGGDDTINGGGGADVIFGQEGNDFIDGGSGADLLWGGSGADTFFINAMADGVDTIKDFNTAEGDILDISNILTGFDPLTESIHDFVKIVSSGGDSIVQIDTTGSGTAYQTIAVLEGVTVDVDTLTTNGNLIA